MIVARTKLRSVIFLFILWAAQICFGVYHQQQTGNHLKAKGRGSQFFSASDRISVGHINGHVGKQMVNGPPPVLRT